MADIPKKSTGGLQATDPYASYLQSSGPSANYVPLDYGTDQQKQYVNDLFRATPDYAQLADQNSQSDHPDYHPEYSGAGYTPSTIAHYTPEQAVALYNAMDPALANDPVMAEALTRAAGYFKQGQFAPGAKTATADLLQKAQTQWASNHAADSKNIGLAAALVGGGMGLAASGAFGAAGAAGSGSGAAGAGYGAGAGSVESGFVGTGALSGAAGVGTDLGAASALGSGALTTAGTDGAGALTTVANAGTDQLAGDVLSKAALDGTTQFGANSVAGAFDQAAYEAALANGATTADAVAAATSSGGGAVPGAANSAQEAFRASEITAQNSGQGALDLLGNPVMPGSSSIFDKIKNPFVNTDGSYNLANILAAAGTGIGLAGKIGQTTPTLKSLTDLGAIPFTGGLGGNPGGTGGPSGFGTGFTPAQMAAFSTPFKAGDELSRIYSSDMKSPITKGVSTRKYAEGGPIQGALTQSAPFVGFVQGDGGGQADLIDASLSAGEYVFDAESVSMLGDGNNAEGAKKLDELRQQLRAQKRSAPNDQIAPPAQGPLSYIGGQNG